MDEQYIYKGKRLYNIQGRELVIDDIEWRDKNIGYIYVFFKDEIDNDDGKIKTFSTEYIGTYLFYEKNELKWKDNLEILRTDIKYAKYSKVVNENIKAEQEKKENEENEILKCLDESFTLLELQDYLGKEFNFQGFIHTTDFSNFINIMGRGFIYSRKRDIEEGLLIIDSANEDIIRGTNKFVQRHVRFYFRPKTPTHYNNEGIRQGQPPHHMPIPVMLIASKNVGHYYNLVFADGNARSSNTIKEYNVRYVYNFDFERIFGKGSYNFLSYDEKKETTRQRNVEVLIPDKVSMKVIDKIIFRSNADLKMANLLFGNDSRFLVDENKFFNNHQFCKDYIFKILDTNLLVYGIKLNKTDKTDKTDIYGYNHALRICYSNSTIEYNLLKKNPIINYDNNVFNIVGTITLDDNRYFEKVEYLINGHVSAFWRRYDD